MFRNINTYGDLSSSYKEDTDHKLLGSIMLNLKYPLIKNNASNKNYLTPLASLRYSPKKGLNFRDNKTLFKFENLMMMDRINNKTVESGLSATVGIEYISQDSLNNDKFRFGVAVNKRDNEDSHLPLS